MAVIPTLALLRARLAFHLLAYTSLIPNNTQVPKLLGTLCPVDPSSIKKMYKPYDSNACRLLRWMLPWAKGYPILPLSGPQRWGFCSSAKLHFSLYSELSLSWNGDVHPLPAPSWSFGTHITNLFLQVHSHRKDFFLPGTTNTWLTW